MRNRGHKARTPSGAPEGVLKDENEIRSSGGDVENRLDGHANARTHVGHGDSDRAARSDPPALKAAAVRLDDGRVTGHD